MVGIEPTKWWSQSPLPYRLATFLYKCLGELTKPKLHLSSDPDFHTYLDNVYSTWQIFTFNVFAILKSHLVATNIDSWSFCFIIYLVPTEGLEPSTGGFEDHCSTIELSRYINPNLNDFSLRLGPYIRSHNPDIICRIRFIAITFQAATLFSGSSFNWFSFHLYIIQLWGALYRTWTYTLVLFYLSYVHLHHWSIWWTGMELNHWRISFQLIALPAVVTDPYLITLSFWTYDYRTSPFPITYILYNTLVIISIPYWLFL